LSFSHELRNLLNSILGNIEIINQEKNLSETIAKCADDAKIGGELLLQEVNNILDTGKVETGMIEIASNPH